MVPWVGDVARIPARLGNVYTFSLLLVRTCKSAGPGSNNSFRRHVRNLRLSTTSKAARKHLEVDEAYF
jgi:hypothetical protein